MYTKALQKIYFSAPGVFSSAGKNIDELWNAVCSGDNSGIKKIKTLSGKEFFAGRVDDCDLPQVNARLNMKIIRMEAASLFQIEKFILDEKEKYGAERYDPGEVYPHGFQSGKPGTVQYQSYPWLRDS